MSSCCIRRRVSFDWTGGLAVWLMCVVLDLYEKEKAEAEAVAEVEAAKEGAEMERV